MVLSELPLAIQVPSGWNLTELTTPLWSSNVLISYLDEKSQSLTFRSSEPDAINLVSAENWQALIQF